MYNSVPSDNGEMISIDTEINNRVKDGVTAYNIYIDDTVKGVRRLKLGKSDGEEGLSSDYYKRSKISIRIVNNGVQQHANTWSQPRIYAGGNYDSDSKGQATIKVYIRQL